MSWVAELRRSSSNSNKGKGDDAVVDAELQVLPPNEVDRNKNVIGGNIIRKVETSQLQTQSEHEWVSKNCEGVGATGGSRRG